MAQNEGDISANEAADKSQAKIDLTAPAVRTAGITGV